MLVCFSLFLFFLDSRGYLEKNLRAWLQGAVSPFQYAVNLPNKILDTTLSAFVSQARLLKENQILKTQLIVLKLQHQRFIDLENENRQLRTLLHASEDLQAQVKIAEVLFVASAESSSQWVLNKGSRDDVYVGQAVLDAEGVLGQVVMVGPSTSRVMLISDPKSSVPVESVQSGVRSIVQGDGVNQPLSLAFIPKTEKIAVGEMLVSSGVGDRFPKGYPVGTISAINDRVGDQFLSVDVLPVAPLEHERFVLLLWPHGFTPSATQAENNNAA